MSQMTSSGNGCEIASTRSTSPFSHMASMTSVQMRLDRVEDALQLARREQPRDDAALPGVARVVHADERSEELHRFGRHVGDRDRALARAEVGRVPADLDQLRVAGDREELERFAAEHVGGLRAGERSGLSHHREVGHALVERTPPELRIAELPTSLESSPFPPSRPSVSVLIMAQPLLPGCVSANSRFLFAA